MTPNEWLLKRARLNHHEVRNRLMLSVAALRGMLSGRITDVREVKSRIESIASQMAEVESIARGLLEQMELTLSPRSILARVLHRSSEASGVIEDCAHELWLQTSGVVRQRTEARKALSGCVKHCSEMVALGQAPEGDQSGFRDTLDRLTLSICKLSEALSALPRHPGLCFQEVPRIHQPALETTGPGMQPVPVMRP
jgi:hypothetical protein